MSVQPAGPSSQSGSSTGSTPPDTTNLSLEWDAIAKEAKTPSANPSAFSLALTAGKDKAISPTPYGYFDLVPLEPSFVGPGPTTLGPTFVWPGGTVYTPGGPEEPGPGDNAPGSLSLGPTFVSPGPVSPSKADDPKEEAEPGDMPRGLSPAEEAAVYAGEAENCARSTATIAEKAAELALEVEAEAAFAGFSGKTRKEVATALTEAKEGADAAAAAAKAAKVAAFDAGVDAASAAAAEADGDDAQADADAAAAGDACAVAVDSQTAAYAGWYTVLVALRSLRNPDA